MRTRFTKGFWLVSILTLVLGLTPAFADDPNFNPVPTGQASENAAKQSGPAGAEVTMKFFQFQPKEVVVPVGTTVTWVNEDVRAHTVRFADNPAFGGKAPVSPELKQGAKWSYTFAKAGVYEFGSDSRASMKGTIRVVETAPTVVVKLKDFAFQPAKLEVAPGTVLVFENDDPTQHNVRFNVNPNNSRELASPYLGKGDKWSYVVIAEGTYKVLCDPHPFMTGEINVVQPK